jgi:ATP-dependent helicase/nuclease subunit A
LEAHTVLLLDTCTVAKNPKPLEVLVDWPGTAQAPQTFAFLRSEGSAPECVREALANEREQRAREEINALYVAMTRAKQQLVFSGHEMNKAADPLCPWMRLDTLAQADEQAVEEVWHGDFAAPAEQGDAIALSAPFLMKNMPLFVDVSGIESAQAAINLIVNQATEPSTSARIGIAMHRLLELYSSDTDITTLLPAIRSSQNLSETEAAQALQAAQTIIQGEAAWVWDETQIDWQANEAELMHAGQLLRLDRLIKHTATQTWWVIDYKSAPAPQRVPELKTQLQQYQAAVQAANPGSKVKAAFITAQGALIEI